MEHDTHKSARRVAQLLGRKFNSLGLLEEALTLATHDEDRTDDGNRKLARIGRLAVELLVSTEARSLGATRGR